MPETLPIASSLILSHWNDYTSIGSPGSLLKSSEELQLGKLAFSLYYLIASGLFQTIPPLFISGV